MKAVESIPCDKCTGAGTDASGGSVAGLLVAKAAVLIACKDVDEAVAATRWHRASIVGARKRHARRWRCRVGVVHAPNNALERRRR